MNRNATLTEALKLLPDTPQLTLTEQGVDVYPRVLKMETHGDNHMLVTFALPGLRRMRVLMPLDKWVAGEHSGIHAAAMEHLSGMLPGAGQPPPTDT